VPVALPAAVARTSERLAGGGRLVVRRCRSLSRAVPDARPATVTGTSGPWVAGRQLVAVNTVGLGWPFGPESRDPLYAPTAGWRGRDQSRVAGRNLVHQTRLGTVCACVRASTRQRLVKLSDDELDGGHPTSLQTAVNASGVS